MVASQLRERGAIRADQPQGEDRPPPQHAASCEVLAIPEHVAQMRAFTRVVLNAWGVSDSAADDVELIVSELVSNAVEHSGSGSVSVTVTLCGRVLCLTVRDEGRWSGPRSGRRRCENVPVRGRGLALVRALATTSGRHCSDAGTQVWAQRVLTEQELHEASSAC